MIQIAPIVIPAGKTEAYAEPPTTEGPSLKHIPPKFNLRNWRNVALDDVIA